MRILQLHNKYSSGHGGEDSVIEAERALLANRGHDVIQIFASNATIKGAKGLRALQTGVNLIWSASSYAEARSAFRRFRPEVVHVHNTFAKLSASVFWAARAERVPVVLTLHNYRITCARTVLLRDGRPCEQCVGRAPVAAWIHRCAYTGSRSVGAALAAAQLVHGIVGTYRRKIDAFVALTDFARDIFCRAGLPAERLHVKPNFVPTPAFDLAYLPTAGSFLFVGLISTEKGVDLLLDASGRVDSRHRIVIVGEGSDRARIQADYPRMSNVDWRGQLPPVEVLKALAESRWLVLPSRWYEGMSVVVLEAFAAGRPVIVPDHGAFPSMVWPNRNALLFRPNDPDSLADTLTQALSMPDEEWTRFSRAAREQHQLHYTPEKNYELLINIYNAAADAAARPL